MTLKPESTTGSANLRLANYLGARREPIISEWLNLVRADPAIKVTDILNSVAVRNHMPEIIDDLTASLRRYGCELVAEKTVKDAEEHGATRMNQGYELPEMLREIKHLRAVLIHQLHLFQEDHPDDGMAARLFLATTLHGFLDEIVIDATEEYLWSRQSLEARTHRGYVQC